MSTEAGVQCSANVEMMVVVSEGERSEWKGLYAVGSGADLRDRGAAGVKDGEVG